MKTLDIFYLTFSRPNFLVAHAREIAAAIKKKPVVNSVVFLGNPGRIPQEIKDELKAILGLKLVIEDHYKNEEYMAKLDRIASSKSDYTMKIDEDCYMTSESWVKMFDLMDEMQDNDLFGTGCITNGIPTCDLFLQNHAPKVKDQIETDYFCKAQFYPINGADYRVLNHPSLKMKWNPDLFWHLLSTVNHPYQGIHPMRLMGDANIVLNDHIVNNFDETMLPKDLAVLHEKDKYPHYCPQVLLMKPENLTKVLSSKELFYDMYDEVPLNLYREKHGMSMAIGVGIPILHTMFNWSQQYDYERTLIDRLCKISETRNKQTGVV